MTVKENPMNNLFTPPDFKSEDAASRMASVMDHSQRMVNDFWAKQTKQASGTDFQFLTHSPRAVRSWNWVHK